MVRSGGRKLGQLVSLWRCCMTGPDEKKEGTGMDEETDWDRILEDLPDTPGWLRVDEREDAIGAIEHAADTQLLLQHPANTIRLEDEQKARVETAIDKLRSTLEPQPGGRGQR